MGKRGRKQKQRSKMATEAPAQDTWRLALFETGVGRPDWRMIEPGVRVPVEAILIADPGSTGGWVLRDPPERAVIGDISKQNTGYSSGYPAYVDIDYICCDCKGPGLFRAMDQKRYYETEGNSIWAGAVRCRDCRVVQRQQKDANTQLGEALRSYNATRSPADALHVAQLTATAGPMMGRRARTRGLHLAKAAEKAGLDASALIQQLTETPRRW